MILILRLQIHEKLKNSKFCYEPAGHIITGNLKIISDSRIRSLISKGPKYRLPSQINFNKCIEEIAVALNEFCKRWCRREYVECNALNSWKISIFNIIEKRISFYSKNLNLLPPKPKLSFRHLKQGIQQFHEKFVLAPADKASNNAIVVWRLYLFDTLKVIYKGFLNSYVVLYASLTSSRNHYVENRIRKFQLVHKLSSVYTLTNWLDVRLPYGDSWHSLTYIGIR